MSWTPPEKNVDDAVREYLAACDATPDTCPSRRAVFLALERQYACSTVGQALTRWREDWFRARGEPHRQGRRGRPRAISEEHYPHIVQMRADGMLQYQIAERYGVHSKTIAAILREHDEAQAREAMLAWARENVHHVSSQE